MFTYIQQHLREEVYREQGNGPKTKVLWQSLAVGEELSSKEVMIAGIG